VPACISRIFCESAVLRATGCWRGGDWARRGRRNPHLGRWGGLGAQGTGWGTPHGRLGSICYRSYTCFFAIFSSFGLFDPLWDVLCRVWDVESVGNIVRKTRIS